MIGGAHSPDCQKTQVNPHADCTCQPPALRPVPVKLWDIPAGTEARKCHKCPEMIYDVTSTANPETTMPLSVQPTLQTKRGVVATLARRPNSIDAGKGFSHFSNCPHARSFRK